MAKLKTLHLNNVGVHKDLEIKFGEKFTTISGANKQGKTTIERSILSAIESIKDNMIKIGSEEGKIELELDDGTKILQPLKSDEKPPVRLYQNGMEIKKPRTRLDEMATAKIRAIDFFKGNGVKLEKEQVETLLSIIDFKLDKKEIEGICKELPLEDMFNLLHPLDYIKALVNDKDGHYYLARAENNTNIQIIQHTIHNRRQKILDTFNSCNENFDTFNIEDYKDIDLTSIMAQKVELQRLHTAKEEKQEFIDIFDSKLAEKHSNVEIFLEAKREELKGEYIESVDKKKNDLYDKVYENALNQLNSAYKEYGSFDIPAFIAKLKTLEIKTNSYYKEKVKVIEDMEKVIDDNVEKQIELYKINLNEKIDLFKLEKVEAAKFIEDNKELESVEGLQLEIDKIYKIQKILPTYETFIENKSTFVSKKATREYYNEIITELRDLPKKLLQRLKTPVENLTITNKGKFAYINFNGDPVPLNQLSGFEQITLSLDVSIAKLGYIRTLIIPQWAEVDDENKELTIKHLIKNNVQGIAVKVGPGDLKIVGI